jgi:EAL domain-containing protein (putative c-di-GMP-specific phosphodiesterase class I)
VELVACGSVDRLLSRLADQGCRISLDDYGTGYTSATYFERFPVHSVKLDRSVIATVSHGKASAVVCGVAAFAASLGLLVLAEGIETEDQVAPLSALGFTLAQGWLFARAGRPEEIVSYAAENSLARADLLTAVRPAGRTRVRAVL